MLVGYFRLQSAPWQSWVLSHNHSNTKTLPLSLEEKPLLDCTTDRRNMEEDLLYGMQGPLDVLILQHNA
jgi:hypothetical protein